MYWPGMTNAIEEMIAKCPTYAKFKSRNKKEPLMPHDFPDRPWSKIRANIFLFGGRPHLVVADYFSKYPEVCRLQTSTVSCVLQHLKSIMQDMAYQVFALQITCHLQQNGTLR